MHVLCDIYHGQKKDYSRRLGRNRLVHEVLVALGCVSSMSWSNSRVMSRIIRFGCPSFAIHKNMISEKKKKRYVEYLPRNNDTPRLVLSSNPNNHDVNTHNTTYLYSIQIDATMTMIALNVKPHNSMVSSLTIHNIFTRYASISLHT